MNITFRFSLEKNKINSISEPTATHFILTFAIAQQQNKFVAKKTKKRKNHFKLFGPLFDFYLFGVESKRMARTNGFCFRLRFTRSEIDGYVMRINVDSFTQLNDIHRQQTFFALLQFCCLFIAVRVVSKIRKSKRNQNQWKRIDWHQTNQFILTNAKWRNSNENEFLFSRMRRRCVNECRFSKWNSVHSICLSSRCYDEQNTMSSIRHRRQFDLLCFRLVFLLLLIYWFHGRQHEHITSSEHEQTKRIKNCTLQHVISRWRTHCRLMRDGLEINFIFSLSFIFDCSRYFVILSFYGEIQNRK